jgi:hypothetical protein
VWGVLARIRTAYIKTKHAATFGLIDVLRVFGLSPSIAILTENQLLHVLGIGTEQTDGGDKLTQFPQETNATLTWSRTFVINEANL